MIILSYMYVRYVDYFKFRMDLKCQKLEDFWDMNFRVSSDYSTVMIVHFFISLLLLLEN